MREDVRLCIRNSIRLVSRGHHGRNSGRVNAGTTISAAYWTRRTIRTLHSSRIVGSHSLLASLACCGLSWALVLAFWRGRRLLGICLGDLALVIVHPLTCLQSRKFNSPWLTGFPTRLQVLPDENITIGVLLLLAFCWRPGQHCFFRFPPLSVFDSNPFIIASASLFSSECEVWVFWCALMQALPQNFRASQVINSMNPLVHG